LVFATVAGEEQGLFGSAHMAQQMKAAGADVQGMFSNDIVGASQAWDGTKPDPHTLRLFVEGIPTAVTPAQGALLQSVGGENDGATHQLARFVTESAPFDLTDMNIRVIWRRDRYLRASDHVSFQQQGYPAARFTEPRENFNHEHQNTQVVNGVQLGDLIDFVDFDYIARVTKVNAAALWALASSPSTPKNAQIHTAPPVNFAGTNLTTLDWKANPEGNLTGYEVVMRETTDSDWTSAIPVGNVTTVTLNISKDNVQFGIRAVDKNGTRSPAASPQVVNSPPAEPGVIPGVMAARGSAAGSRFGLAESLLGVRDPPGQQAGVAGQRRRAAQQLDGARDVAGGQLRPAGGGEGGPGPPRVPPPLAQGERMPELPHRLARADVLDQVVKPHVPVHLRAPVPVAAFLHRLRQAKRLPEVRHRGGPIPAQHLEHQAHAEQAPRGAGRVTG